MEVNSSSLMKPKEWRDVSVDDIRSSDQNALSTGPFGSSIGSRFFQSSGVPLIRGSNLAADGCTHLIEDNFVFVSETKATELSRSLVYKGDLIFTCWGTINQVGLISDQVSYSKYIISNKQMKLTPDPNKADSLFLFYLFSSDELQKQIVNQSIGTSVPGFNLGQLRSLRFSIPPLSEQKAIAEALGDADALTEALGQLITKKRQVKQGAMQELLTGKKRLPGFSGEWTTKKLGELGKFYKGKGLPKDVLCEDGRFPAIPYTAIYTDFKEAFDISSVRNYTSTSDTVFINDPHILIAGSSNMLENVGKVCSYDDHKPVAIGGDIILYKTTAVVRFISYLLNTPQHRKKIVFLSQGSTIRHVYISTFMQYEVEIPEVKEQTAIAKILSDMDAEIAALEGKLAKARQVKQGMMQELLTGRIRLV